jgi:hypothetical protein
MLKSIRSVRDEPILPAVGATILDFGRFAGQSLSEIARSDPDYLDWLARAPIGWPLRTEIKATIAALAAITTGRPVPTSRPR